MIILVINCGSSTLRYQLMDMNNEKCLSKGICDRIGIRGSFLKFQSLDREEVAISQDIQDHSTAVKLVLKNISDPEHGVINSMSEISAVGHRVVHGGEYFHQSVLIDNEVLETIKECSKLAPLHNPSNIIGIETCKELLPDAPMVAVFDTAFHQTMPKYAYMYGLPYETYEKYRIRKYGFHGTSHRYVAHRAAEVMGIPIEELKIISCHLGGGASICAIDRGESIDTSMGFTPLEGLIMGTRSGSIDPAIVPMLMEKENLGTTEIDNLLNKKSGILGLSGISSDFRDVQKAAYQYNEKAKLTIDVFCYRIKLFIGQYIAALNGVDVIIFTAGIGEHDWRTREKCVENLDNLGIKIDHEKNKNAVHRSLSHQEIDITAKGSKVKTYVIHTNEELMIAKDTFSIIQHNKG